VTFEQARAKFVRVVPGGGAYGPSWPEGYDDGDSNHRYHGSVGEVGVFEVYADGAMRVDLWTAEPNKARTRLTAREAHALAGLLIGGR
jgi:hypothetical protein